LPSKNSHRWSGIADFVVELVSNIQCRALRIWTLRKEDDTLSIPSSL
jgi:hypothetical protein